MNDKTDNDLDKGDDELRALHEQAGKQISDQHHAQILDAIDSAVAKHAPSKSSSAGGTGAKTKKWSQRFIAPISLAAGIVLGVAVTINTGTTIPDLDSAEGEAIFLDFERSRDPSAPLVPLSIKEWKEFSAERQREFISSLVKDGKTRAAEILLRDHRQQYGDEKTTQDF